MIPTDPPYKPLQVDYVKTFLPKDSVLFPFVLTVTSHSGPNDLPLYLDSVLSFGQLSPQPSAWFFDKYGFRSLYKYIQMFSGNPKNMIGETCPTEPRTEALQIKSPKENEFIIKVISTTGSGLDRYVGVENGQVVLVGGHSADILKFKATRARPKAISANEIISNPDGIQFKMIKGNTSVKNWHAAKNPNDPVWQDNEIWIGQNQAIKPANDPSLALTVKEVNGKLEVGLEKVKLLSGLVLDATQKFIFSTPKKLDPHVLVKYVHQDSAGKEKGEYFLDLVDGRLVVSELREGAACPIPSLFLLDDLQVCSRK